nr:PREDICTED: spermatogenesis-associated protein 31D1-like [Rhinolophus sinicus]
MRFRRMLCPDPFCEMCNHATAEINSLLFQEALEDATPSVSPLASTASVTESSFPLSPAFSALPPGHPIPAPLPEPSSSPPPILSTNAMTPLPNSPSLLSPGHSLPPKLFHPLESKFPAEHSQGQPPGTPSCGISRADLLLQLEAPLTLNTLFLDPSLYHHIDSLPDLSQKLIPTNSSAYDHEAAVRSTSPSPDSNFTVTRSEQPKSDNHLTSSTTMLESAADKQDSVVTLPFVNSKDKPTEVHVRQQPSHPEAWEASLLENHICLFWGFPSLHSESLSAVHVLGDYSSIFIFNRISNASTCQEYPILFHPLPPSLPEVQPQPFAQTLPQAHLLSPLPTLPSGPLPQSSRSGVHFHRPQNESDTITTSEMQHLVWHVLRKQQERLWGLPSVVQQSHDAFYSSAPHYAYCRPSQAQVSVSILLGDIPMLSNELRKTLDHHLRKRLIQHRWGLPRRIHESLSLLRPLSYCADTSESKSNYGLSWICAYKGQNSKNHLVCLSPPSSSSDSSTNEEDELKSEGDRPENGRKDDVSRDAESSSAKDPGYNSEEDPDSFMMGLSGGSPMVLRQRLRQGQVENVLKVHSGTKFEDINAGWLPVPVHRAWPDMKQIPTLSVNAHTETKQRSASPSVGGDCCLNTCQDLSFLECCAQQSLESHMKKFCLRMRYGLPSKVLESLEIAQLKDISLYSNLTSSMNLGSEVSSTSGSFMPLRGSATSLHGDDMTTAHSYSTSIPAHPLSATSYVGQEGQGTLSESPSDIQRGLTGDIQRMREAGQTLLPVTQSITDQESLKQTLLINTPSPKLPTMRPAARHERKDQSVITTDQSERQKGKEMENQSESVSVPVTRVLFRAKELKGLQSNTRDILTTSKPGISQGIPVNENKRETTVSPESPPAKMLFLQDAKLPDSREHLSGELQSEPENREGSQAEGPYSDMSIASDGLTYTAPWTHAQGVSRMDMGAPQVMHVCLEDRGVCVQQRQEPWLPERILKCGQDKNFPQAKRRGSHQGPRSEALGGGDTGLETSWPGMKSVPPQEAALEEVLGSKSSQTLAQQGLSPLERLLRIKMKRFFRWICPGVKCEQENSQEKCSPLSSAGSRGPDKSTRAFTGAIKGPKVMTGMGKFLQEKLGRRHTTDMPCTQERLPSPVKLGQAQQKAQVRAQAGLIRRHPFNSRPPCCKVTKSCQQASGFAGQSSTRLRHIQDRDRQPHQKAGSLKEQLLYQKCFQSRPCRETMPHPSPGQSSTSLRQTRDKGRQPQKATAFKEQSSCEKNPRSMPHREAVPHPSHTYQHHGGQASGCSHPC